MEQELDYSKRHDCREFEKCGGRFHFFKPQYSDESDFSEYICMVGVEEIMQRDLYLNGQKLEISSPQELSLYYAFGFEKCGMTSDGRRFEYFGNLDKNSWQAIHWAGCERVVKKYRENWVEAIIANGYEESFAREWVYEQGYQKGLKPRRKEKYE